MDKCSDRAIRGGRSVVVQGQIEAVGPFDSMRRVRMTLARKKPSAWLLDAGAAVWLYSRMRMQQPTAGALGESVELSKAFADPARLRLLNLLADGEFCGWHLHEALELAQSTVSRQLAYLRKRGLVVGRKERLWVYYRLARPAVTLHGRLIHCLEGCREESQALKSDRQKIERRTCCDG